METYYTLEKESPFAIKDSDFKALDQERPLGISGHMRVKNEPKTVALSILTALPALDELIITCQPFINESGEDETYEICKKLQNLYPHKIRLFYYLPEMIAINSSHIKNDSIESQRILKSFNATSSGGIPENSIHSIVHYYNWGLVKIQYKYYVKIDADQIYLTSKMIQLRENILKYDYLQKPTRSFSSKVLGRALPQIFYPFFARHLSQESFIKFCLKVNQRCAYGLMGLNLAHAQGDSNQTQLYPFGFLRQLFVPIKAKELPIFNGGVDTLVFIPNSQTFYCQDDQGRYEVLKSCNAKLFPFFGIFFLHYGAEKRNMRLKGKEGKDYISLDTYLKTPLRQLLPYCDVLPSIYQQCLLYTKNTQMGGGG